MTDTTRKRHEQRAGFDARLAEWRALDEARHCRACHDVGTVLHEDGELPCPYCRPDSAREAARGATP